MIEIVVFPRKTDAARGSDLNITTFITWLGAHASTAFSMASAFGVNENRVILARSASCGGAGV